MEKKHSSQSIQTAPQQTVLENFDRIEVYLK